MTVTVVIPSFNSGVFIKECIDSVLAQGDVVSEAIVVDDKSQDATCDFVEALAAADSRIRLIRLSTNSGGPATPINVGIAASRTELIALLDHDDIMLAGKLRMQSRWLINRPELGFVFSNYDYVTGVELRPGMTDQERSLLQSFATFEDDGWLVAPREMVQLQVARPGLIQSCSNLMFRKSVWESVGGFDPADGAISDHRFKLAVASCRPICFLPQVLFRKRLHETNLFSESNSPTLMYLVDAMGFRTLCEQSFDSGISPAISILLRQELLDGMYSCRESGQYSLSCWYVRNYLKVFGIDRRLAMSVFKWPLAVVRNILRRTTASF